MFVMRPTCYWSVVVLCLIFLYANRISGNPSSKRSQVYKIITDGIDADIIMHENKPPSDLAEHILEVCRSIVGDVIKKFKHVHPDANFFWQSDCRFLYQQKFTQLTDFRRR